MQIEARRADITREDVDAIVNAANVHLARGDGVCGAIFAAAGPDLDAACAALGGCGTGDAKATPGFALPARWIVHTVGPVWHGGGHGEADLLASCYRRSVEVASGVGARSIAFPAISTGIFGYPIAEAAAVAVPATQDALGEHPSIEHVRFVVFNDETERAFSAAVSESRTS